MRVSILSRGPRLYSTRRLKQAVLARGHEARVLDTLKLSIVVEQGRPDLLYRGKPLGHYDAVIPRIGSSITFYGCAVLRQFEQMGVFTLNSSHAVSVSRDKLRSHQILSRHSLGIPQTIFVRDKEQVLTAIELVGGAPVIIKVLEGTQGVGVILADTEKTAQAIIETLQMARQNVLIQKFVAESRGCDLRAFVVGDRVVASMRRLAREGEFRSNVHRGGRAEKVELDENYQRTAIMAAQILGLHVAGVDMLEGRDGPVVLEVNSSPGLQGIETATGIDVADTIVRLLEDKVLFPEVDLRQRLTLKSGYGVAEVTVARESPLANKTLRELDLRQREVLVLNILRGSITIPSPNGDAKILPGDHLICHGKLLTLKLLMAARTGEDGDQRADERANPPG
jgi:ribosomal protein S6--L-glutamate ligase